jgi:hypothetical protein
MHHPVGISEPAWVNTSRKFALSEEIESTRLREGLFEPFPALAASEHKRSIPIYQQIAHDDPPHGWKNP